MNRRHAGSTPPALWRHPPEPSTPREPHSPACRPRQEGPAPPPTSPAPREPHPPPHRRVLPHPGPCRSRSQGCTRRRQPAAETEGAAHTSSNLSSFSYVVPPVAVGHAEGQPHIALVRVRNIPLVPHAVPLQPPFYQPVIGGSPGDIEPGA